MLWQQYFKLVGLVPGRVIVQGYGEIDFSKEVSPEKCLDICENTTGVLKITEAGKEKFYGIPPRAEAHPSLKGGELKPVVIKNERVKRGSKKREV